MLKNNYKLLLSTTSYENYTMYAPKTLFLGYENKVVKDYFSTTSYENCTKNAPKHYFRVYAQKS